MFPLIPSIPESQIILALGQLILQATNIIRPSIGKNTEIINKNSILEHSNRLMYFSNWLSFLTEVESIYINKYFLNSCYKSHNSQIHTDLQSILVRCI